MMLLYVCLALLPVASLAARDDDDDEKSTLSYRYFPDSKDDDADDSLEKKDADGDRRNNLDDREMGVPLNEHDSEDHEEGLPAYFRRKNEDNDWVNTADEFKKYLDTYRWRDQTDYDKK